MGNGSKSSSHQLFKDKAKDRVDDLQGIFSDLQSARQESRAADVALLEEQVHQMLREWRAELNEPSPQNSLHGKTGDSFSETLRMLHLSELEDDATSKLEELVFGDVLKPEQVELPQPDAGVVQVGDNNISIDDYLNNELSGKEFLYCEQYESTLPAHNATYPYENNLPTSFTVLNCLEASHSDYQQDNLHKEMAANLSIDVGPVLHNEEDVLSYMSDMATVHPPSPAAFLGPKCALWDCSRPAQKVEYYCSNFHATLALEEGQPNKTSVVRPGGIDVKDGLLFNALTAKAQGKNVGIPTCEGAATSKSPWNATDLFPSAVEGESCREWLFFDKPRKAFDSGNRKQRSLPDHIGRGWHESRKVKTDELKDVSKKNLNYEIKGSRRSYYMDPQPMKECEWHLYEYELADFDAFALYRLEYKLVDPKRIAKTKLTSNSSVNLQQQMGKLDSGNSLEKKKGIKTRTKANQKDILEKSPTVTSEKRGENY